MLLKEVSLFVFKYDLSSGEELEVWGERWRLEIIIVGSVVGGW